MPVIYHQYFISKSKTTHAGKENKGRHDDGGRDDS